MIEGLTQCAVSRRWCTTFPTRGPASLLRRRQAGKAKQLSKIHRLVYAESIRRIGMHNKAWLPDSVTRLELQVLQKQAHANCGNPQGSYTSANVF